MNEYDTELIRSILLKENFAFVKDELEADIVMLNTCAIRENAHRKVYGRIHDIRHNRRNEPNGHNKPVMIGILGCMATNLRTDLLENRNLKIDFIAGPDSYKKLPDLIREAAKTGEKTFDLTLSEFETYSDIYPARKDGVNAWIAVMRGCNNFCTFCVVPYTRGRERSRSVDNIVEEVKKLTADEFKQVTLLGQNVNSYCDPISVIASPKGEAIFSEKIASSPSKYLQALRNDTKTRDFAHLLECVSKVNGIERIRFTSPHPKDFPRRLLQVIADNPKICKHIHLPLQAGNDRVLDVMNRTYTQKEFLDLVDEIRTLYPAMVLTTDIIVGFPTETDAEFEDTIKVMQHVEFDSAFIFKYSERKGTAAKKKFPDDVPEAIKTERIVRLNEIQKAISLKKNQAHIGQIHAVLIEEESSERSEDDFQGRTDGNKVVIFPAGNYKKNDFINIRITDATVNVLKGTPVN